MRRIRVNRGFVAGTVIAAAAMTIGVGGAGYAATGHPFILGQANQANQTSVLKGTVGTPLSLKAPLGKSPLKVNSSVRVDGLNADQIDGLDSTSFAKAGAVVRTSAPVFTPSEGPINRQARAFCHSDEHAVGGGDVVTALTADRLGEYFTFVAHSAPIDGSGNVSVPGAQAAGWLVEATNTAHTMTGGTAKDADLTAYAVCVPN